MTTMIRKPVSELEGAQLDWAVAVADDRQIQLGFSGIVNALDDRGRLRPFIPSDRWQDAGPIIERELIEIEVCQIDPVVWQARCSGKPSDWPIAMEGPTPIIAAMRAFVTSRLGNEVEVPDGQA